MTGVLSMIVLGGGAHGVASADHKEQVNIVPGGGRVVDSKHTAGSGHKITKDRTQDSFCFFKISTRVIFHQSLLISSIIYPKKMGGGLIMTGLELVMCSDGQ